MPHAGLQLTKEEMDEMISYCDHRVEKYTGPVLEMSTGMGVQEQDGIQCAAAYATVAAHLRTVRAEKYPPPA